MIHRTMIVPAVQVELARSLAAAVSGPAGDGMWTAAYSETGKAPATHYVSTGLIDEALADLMPLTTYVKDADGKETATTTPGKPDVIHEMSGGAAPLEAITALLDACEVTDEPWEVSCGRFGIKLVQDEA